MMGRNRKSGDRYPSGKLKPAAPVDRLKPTAQPISGVLWQRLRRHGKQLGLDPRLASELGRLNMFGELTVAQTAAGFRVAEIYGRFEHFQQQSRSARSPSYNASYGEAGLAEELLSREAFEELQARVAAATEAWRNLQKELRPWLRATIEQLCVEDQQVSPAFYGDVRAELDHLATIWKVSSSAAQGGHHQSSANNRHHTPLHFNAHENEAGATAAAAPKPTPKPNIDRIYWMKVIGRLRPDLDVKQLGEAYDLQQALKQREIVRRSVAKKSGNVVPLRRE